MSYTWTKGDFSVKVMFSLPGIATQLLVSAAHEKTDLLLDCGGGTLRDLFLDHYHSGEGFGRIRAVLVSHEHFDHVGGLYSLMDFMHMIGRREPLRVLVPRPSIVVRSFVDTLKTFRRLPLAYDVELMEVSDGDRFSEGPINVEAFEVVHRSSTKTDPIGHLIPAVGYSIEYGEMRIAYSGDTGPCDSLAEQVKGADLAVLEATWEEKGDHTEIHLSEEEAIELGRTAKEFVLIHRVRDLKQISGEGFH